MSTRGKIISSVMVLIGAMSVIFILALAITQQRALDKIIGEKVESANLLAKSILQQTTTSYQKRIKGFINHKSAKTKLQFINAFASHDRDSLLQLTRPFLKIFQNESPYFQSLAWVLPDNTALLRIQSPEIYGDNVSSYLPDVVTANATQKQVSGFGTARKGMQYRIVQPVRYEKQHLGIVLFGIRASLISDMLEEKLDVPSGIAIINSQCGTNIKSDRATLKTKTHTISGRNAEIFKLLPKSIDWTQQRQDYSKNSKRYVLLNILSLRNFEDEYLGNYFIILDVTAERQATANLISAALAASGIFLLLSFFIIHYGYRSLVQKIVTLNQSLEENNSQLEDRVRQRTAKLQESERQLHRAQKMEAIGMMAGSVAHDLNNILSGIISYPELLLLQLPKSSELRKPIEAIQDSGNRAATVVADLLTVARGAASTREPHDINQLINEYLESPECKNLKTQHPEVNCTSELNAEHPIISCSPIHIAKTVMNLITNATEAIKGYGDVLISTRNIILEQAEHTMESGEYLLLTVQDNGSGIADKDIEHIFEPFYTKKIMGQSGTGLGLAIVWNTVQDHNGKIFVESNEAGTQFQIYFPVSDESLTNHEESIEIKDLFYKDAHILVVDDELQLRDIATQILQAIGYRVDSVSSGEKAVQFVREQAVDLIVLDMLMEPGMTGYETYKEILQYYPDQRAIIASGYSKSDDVKAALELGANGFIQKPYSITEFGRIVKEVLCH